MSKLLLFILLFTGLIFTAYSQQNSNQTSDEQLLRRANELYNQQKYNAARALFEDYIANFSDQNSVAQAEYLRTLCAIDAGHDDAQVIADNYIVGNPSQRPAIYRSLGLYQFNRGSYDKAATYFAESGLVNSDEEVIFKSGYAFYKIERWKI
jgi:tetratricopeptide (TPR) repeat protein